MAKYGQPDVIIEVDDEVGGTLTDITEHVDTINGSNVEAITQQSDVFGDSWVEEAYVGVRRIEPVEIEGFWDDAADGPDDILNHPGETRSVRITWGGTKTTSFEAIIKTFNRNPVRNELTRYSCTLAPTGAVTEA